MKVQTTNKKAGLALLTPDGMDFNAQTVRRVKGPSNSTLCTYPKKPKNLIQKDTYIHMLIVALFTIAKIRKQPECPWLNEWLKKRCIYTV